MKYRKSNRVKTFAHGCRNNGTCAVCNGDRLAQGKRMSQDDVDDLIAEVEKEMSS